MHSFIRHTLIWLIHLGVFGPLILGVLDSSFLFFPFGNDHLVVALTARDHAHLPLYVLTAALGSVGGVFLLDLVSRKGGEEGPRWSRHPLHDCRFARHLAGAEHSADGSDARIHLVHGGADRGLPGRKRDPGNPLDPASACEKGSSIVIVAGSAPLGALEGHKQRRLVT